MAWFKSKKDREKKSATPDEREVRAVHAAPTKGDSTSYGIISGPHVTEKATLRNGAGTYVFRVGNDAGKISIKKAIQNLYGVHVRSVRTIRVPSKVRRVGRVVGEKSGYKKAIITLNHGETL